MIIDDKLLTKLENLSALKIQDDKKEEFKKQLSEIVNFMEILNEIDLNEFDLNALDSDKTPLRDDEVKNSNEDIKHIIFSNAPDAKDHYFVVPKIIEN